MWSCVGVQGERDVDRDRRARAGRGKPQPRAAGGPLDEQTVGARDPLRKIYLEITSRCNLDCRMCIRRSWETPDSTMSPATFEALMAQLERIPSLQTINFGGFGEPTIHPHFFEFLARVKAAGLCAEVVTNGVRLDGPASERLIDLEVDRLIVSVDGTDGGGVFHASADHGVPAHLRELYRMKRRRGTGRPEVTIGFVASRRNIHLLPSLKRRAAELGFSSILVTNLVPHTAELADEILYAHWTTTNRDSGARPRSPVVDLPRMDPRSAGAAVIEQLQVAGTHLRVCGNDFSGGRMWCRFVNEGYLAIAPDGRVAPCLPLLHTYSYYFRGELRRMRAWHVGNLHDRELGELWNAAAYREFRERVRRFEFSPCIDCGSCELRASNEQDCYGNGFPSCGECLWAAGLVQCP